MAYGNDVRISDLPPAGPIQGDEVIPIVQLGITRRATVDAITGGGGTVVTNISTDSPNRTIITSVIEPMTTPTIHIDVDTAAETTRVNALLDTVQLSTTAPVSSSQQLNLLLPDGTTKSATIGPFPGVTRLDQLSDVSVQAEATIPNGNALLWNSVAQRWVNGPVATTGIDIEFRERPAGVFAADAVALAAWNAYVDGEIAARIGSTSTRTQLSNGSLATTVIIYQVAGQPVQMTVTTRTDASAILATLNGAGDNAKTIAAAAQSSGPTLLVNSWSANVFQIVATFPVTTTLAQVQAVFLNARSDSVYYGGPTTGRFAYQPSPLAENVRIADSEIANQLVAGTNMALVVDPITKKVTFNASGGSGSNENIFNLGQPLIADNVGILVKTVSTTPILINVVGTVNNNGDFGAVTITSAGFPPTIPAGYNSQYVGISSADNKTWGGVGRIAANSAGIEQIAWKVPPASLLNFTDAKVWLMVDNGAAIYAANTTSQAADRGPVSTVLFPDATINYVDDTLGGLAASVTFGGSSSPFVLRYDYPYASKTALGTSFLGYLDRTVNRSATGTLTLASATSNTSTVTANVTGLPSGLTNTSSVVAFGPNGAWDITEAIIGVGTITGTFNCPTGTTVAAGTYSTFFSGVTGAAVSSLNGVNGTALISSSDASITVSTVGQTIDLKSGVPSVAGVATGYNVGPYVPANVAVYAGNQTPPSTAQNEGQVQIGTGTGYSTSTTVLAPAPAATPKQGWTFGGQKANNVVFELGTQKQIFRLGVSGTWNSIPAYGTLSVIHRPVVLKYNTDFDSGSPFPGLVTASGSAAPLIESATVTPVARYCTNLGLACATGTFSGQTALGLVSLATVSGSANTPVLIFNTTTTLTATNLGNTSGSVTLPLEVYSGGQWVYLGAEWQISAYTLATNQVQLTLTGAGSYSGNPVRIQNGLTTPMLAWYSGLPPVSTVFGASLTAAAGYVEVMIPANIWTVDTFTYNPTGFTLPTTASAPQGYNFSWTLVSGTQALNTVDYWHFTGNDQYNPSTSANWNNRLTVNYGSSGSSIPGNLWDTWVINWTSEPIELTTDGSASNGATTGDAISYTYQGVTRYRFIPNTYVPGSDAFYSTYTPATKTVSGLLTTRSS